MNKNLISLAIIILMFSFFTFVYSGYRTPGLQSGLEYGIATRENFDSHTRAPYLTGYYGRNFYNYNSGDRYYYNTNSRGSYSSGYSTSGYYSSGFYPVEVIYVAPPLFVEEEYVVWY